MTVIALLFSGSGRIRVELWVGVGLMLLMRNRLDGGRQRLLR